MTKMTKIYNKLSIYTYTYTLENEKKKIMKRKIEIEWKLSNDFHSLNRF